MAIETAELKDVEILSVGNWTGNRKAQVTSSDLDQMVEHFKSGVAEPSLTIDHNDGYTDKVKNFLKVSALGWVNKLWRKGDRLMADFNQVPKQIAELIKAGTLKKRSVEFFPKDEPYLVNGKKIPNVLTLPPKKTAVLVIYNPCLKILKN